MILLTENYKFDLSTMDRESVQMELVPLNAEEVDTLLTDKPDEWITDIPEDRLTVYWTLTVLPQTPYSVGQDIEYVIVPILNWAGITFWHISVKPLHAEP